MPTASDAAVPVRSLSFGGREKAVFVDADGSRVTVSLRGPGSGTVAFDATGNADPSAVVLDGTTADSVVTVAGRTTLRSVDITGALKGFSGRSAGLTGTFTATGAIGSLRVADVTDAAIAFGGGGGEDAPLTLVAGDVFDASVTSAGAIKSLKVASWTNTDDVRDAVAAPAVDAVTSRGDFGASITASAVGKVVVGGQLNGDVRSAGGIVTVTARTMGPVVVFAGVTDTVTALPASAADFVNPAAVLGLVTVKGRFAGAFAGTSVAAPTIGRVALGGIDTSNDEVAFGVAADDIALVTGRFEGAGTFRFKALTDPTQSVDRGDLEVRIF
ncbi:MAG: hypothetical protein JWO31_2478 [Phycisphaerales bacterium]|nr:hypothetical protein [Phycisphaerales bacterium]